MLVEGWKGSHGWKGRYQNITIFYFSNFPDEFKEKNMWEVFQRWGRAWEGFILHEETKLEGDSVLCDF